MNERVGIQTIGITEFKEVKEGDKVDIQILRVGKRQHPLYGEINITEKTINNIKKNFENNERGIELAVDENHEKNHQALGRFKKLYKKGSDTLFATIELTKSGAEKIANGLYKYFSPEILFNKKDEESGKNINDLLVGGAFTNRPFFKGMQSLMMSEVATDKLPKNNNIDNTFILFTNKGNMKTIIELLSKFTENKNLTIKEKEQLNNAFNSLQEEDKTDEMKKAIEEVNKFFNDEEVKEEPKEENQEEKKEKKEEVKEDKEDNGSEEKSKEYKEPEIVLKASEYEALKNLASQTSKLIREKRKNDISNKVKSFSFNENNKKGIILPKSVNEVVDFALSLSEAQSEKFLKIIGTFQSVNFNEYGSNENNDGEDFTEQKEFLKKKMGMSDEDIAEAMKEFKKKC